MSRRPPAVPEVGVIGLVPEAWGGLWMPRHHVLTRLARYFTVVWADPALGWRDYRLTRRRGSDATELVLPEIGGFRVIRPGAFHSRVYRPKAVGRVTRSLRVRAAIRCARANGAREIVLYIWRPEFRFALDVAPRAMSCYHVDDEYSFSTEEQPVHPREVDLLRRADRVILHSPALWEKKSDLAEHPLMIPNGVDYRAFSEPTVEPDDLREIPHPRIGYLGVVKRFLDVPLLLELARRHPHYHFVFVGPVKPLGPDEAPFRELRKLPNVHLVGAREVHEVPAYAQHVDVGIMPYDVDEYTKFIYPLKLHEYLAAGLPVVGTPIRTLMEFDSVITLAEGADAWTDALARALGPEENTARRVAARRAVARENDWEALVHRIATTLAQMMSPEVRRAVAAAAPDFGWMSVRARTG